MALQDILNSIQEKLEEELQKVSDEEEKMLNDIKKQMKKEQDQKLKELTRQKESKINALGQKMEIILKMESRNSLLKAKTKLVDGVFDSVFEDLNKLSDAEYKEWMSSSIKKMDLSEGEIIPAKGKEKLTEEVIKETGLNLKIAKAGDFTGGFIACSKNIEINNTFNSIVFKQLKPEFELQVAKILF